MPAAGNLTAERVIFEGQSLNLRLGSLPNALAEVLGSLQLSG